MARNNQAMAALLLLVAIAGAALQLVYWSEPRETGVRSAGQVMTMVALALLTLFAPQYSKRLDSTRRDWRFGLVFGLIVLGALVGLSWFVYSHYYGPLIHSLNDHVSDE